MILTKEQRMRRWAITREEGMGRFILFRGVIGWGVMVALGTYLYETISEPSFHLPKGLIAKLILFSIGGYFFGRYMWYNTEKQFHDFYNDKA